MRFAHGYFGKELDRRLLLLEGEGEGSGGGGGGAPGGGDPPAPPTAPAGGGAADDDFSKLPKSTQDYISRLRGESQAAREGRVKAEGERDRLAAEKRTADEKASAEKGEFKMLYEQTKADLESERKIRKETTLSSAIREAAAAAGILDPDLTSLIKREGIVVTDSGQVVGAREAVDALKAEKPHFFKTAPAGGGDGGGGGGGGNPPAGNLRGTGPANPRPAGGGGDEKPKDVRGLNAKDYADTRRTAIASLKNAR